MGGGHRGIWWVVRTSEKILATPLNSKSNMNMMKKKYPANNSNSSSLQGTIPMVSISVFKGRPKRKSGRLRVFCVPLSPLYYIFFSFSFNGPGRTVMCSLYMYTSQYLIESFTVRCLFSLRTDIGKQTITLFATINYNPIFNLLKLCGTCSSLVQCIALLRNVR